METVCIPSHGLANSGAAAFWEMPKPKRTPGAAGGEAPPLGRHPNAAVGLAHQVLEKYDHIRYPPPLRHVGTGGTSPMLSTW